MNFERYDRCCRVMVKKGLNIELCIEQRLIRRKKNLERSAEERWIEKMVANLGVEFNYSNSCS